jgi:uncharacterized protein YkwD
MKKWVALIIIGVLIAVGFGYMTAKSNPAPKTTTKQATSKATTPPPSPEPEVTLSTSDIHGLINQERAKAKLRKLDVNDELVNSAAAKCQDMLKKNYYTHNAPDGTPYTNFIKVEVPNYKLSGENLGAGYTDVNAVISDWMRSPKHKENILNAKFTTEGIAVCGKSSQKPGLVIVDHFLQP